MNLATIAGAVIMIVTQAATFGRIEPFWSWNTPIAWTGFIIFADGLVWQVRRDSWLSSAPREFAFLAAVSIPLWLIFEFFNLYLRNWYYVGVPERVSLKYVGDAWAFATIWPAIFEASEIVAVWRSARRARDGRLGTEPVVDCQPAHRDLVRPVVSILVGAVMLASPFVVRGDVARYLAAPVWLGFIFLLDPINDRLGLESMAADWRAGRFDRILNLSIGGVLCGFLWEFWNYWARAKWHYAVPIMERVKLFEMPLPGYLGFPAFALECFTMYVLARRVALIRPGRRIGL